MKLRITRKELDELSFEQKQNLCDLWIPHVHDVAVANVCVDAIEEKYDQITYVIGAVKLLKHNDMLLYDLKFLPEQQFNNDEADPQTEEVEELETFEPDNELVDLSLEDNFSFEFQRPDSYTKQDCVPLLEIGQMIDILERKNYGECDFSLSITIGDYVCDMGKDAFSGSNFDINNKNAELCDILWEAVKALL